jgi:Ca2+-dependent lipid-binding protein
MKKATRAKSSYEFLLTEQDKEAQAARENQQIIIYLFVCLIIIVAWLLGCWQVSFLWIFLLVLLTFVVWWGKVLYLTEEHIKSREIQIHRKRALRQCETAEWVNFVLNRW